MACNCGRPGRWPSSASESASVLFLRIFSFYSTKRYDCISPYRRPCPSNGAGRGPRLRAPDTETSQASERVRGEHDRPTAPAPHTVSSQALNVGERTDTNMATQLPKH